MVECAGRAGDGTSTAGTGEHSAEPVRCSVPEAARRLGITERAVRKRIQAGTMQAERVDGKWLVVLEPVGTSAVPPVVPSGQQSRQRPHVVRQPEPVPASSPAAPPEDEVMPAVPATVPVATVPAEHATDLLGMLRDLQRQNLELAGQVGFLQARLAATQEQLLLAEEEPEPEPSIPDYVEPEPRAPRSFLGRLFGR